MAEPDEQPADEPTPGDERRPGHERQPGSDLPNDERAWELPTLVPSAWVAFWPHPEPPTREEVGNAIAGWVGRELDVDAAQPEPDEGMLWAFVAKIPGILAPVVFWTERAVQADAGQLPDSAMAACKWVIGVQTVLEPGEAHAEYFHVMAMIAGAMPDVAGILDVTTARRFPRAELEQQFLVSDAVPNDEHLWSITAVTTTEDETAPMMLFTTGLARCGVPELEMLEVPGNLSQPAAVLMNHVASLLLEEAPPAPEEPLEVGPDAYVALVPWERVAQFVADEVPGSRAFREVARDDGDGSLMGVRAVICAPEKEGKFKPIWTWPRALVERMETGRVVLYASEHAAEASERRAQRTWPAFATAFASVRRAQDAAVHALADSAFHVQAPVGGADEHDRREQGWFVVHRFDGDTVEAALVDDPVTRQDMHAGDTVRIPRGDVSDWRVFLPDDSFGPDRSPELLAAVDRIRGLA